MDPHHSHRSPAVPEIGAGHVLDLIRTTLEPWSEIVDLLASLVGIHFPARLAYQSATAWLGVLSINHKKKSEA